MIHELKTWVEFFDDVLSGRKLFEVRRADRPFNVGDVLLLKEWNHYLGEYTGREVSKQITYVLQGGQFGIVEGFVVLSICDVKQPLANVKELLNQ